jgi:acyl-coenzyme A thioesterase PaaI-like protein
MLDFALSTAVQSLLPPGESYRTVELVVTSVHAPVPPEGRLEASAQVVSSGGGLLVATGTVRGPRGISVTGRLVALATAEVRPARG